MKLKIGEIVSSNEPLAKLMTSVVPIGTAFRLKEVLKQIQQTLESYDETRKELIEKHGKDGEITPESKNWKKFVDEMNELLTTETELKIKKISQSS